MKRFTFLVFLLTLLVVTLAWSQIPLLEENFLYAPGRLVSTLPYNVRASSGAYQQTISWTKLTYPGYAASGIGMSDSLTADGDDYSIDWANYTTSGTALPATYVNSGSVYLAALVNVQTVTSTVDYFLSMHYNNTFSARVYVQQTGSDFYFGVSKGGTPISYETTARTLGQTYLIVVKYTFIGGTLNDQIDFWVNPAITGSEPAATIANFTDGARNDIAAWVGVAIRQGGATSAPRVLVSGIRMGTDWATTVAPQYVWTGSTSTDFQVSTNWSPNRTSPSVYDVLVFNAGGSITPTNLPTQSISGLVIDNSTTVTLPATGLTVTGSLTLASGTLSSAGNLTLGNGATIVRADGTVDAAPVFGASTNLTYCGTSAQTTGSECPATVNNLIIANTSGTTLSSNLAVNSLLKVGGMMSLNGNTVTLGTSAPAMGSITFTNSYGGFSGSGTFKRWFAASTIDASSSAAGRGNNGYFPFTTGAFNNRAILIGGVPSVGGSVSISYNDASSVSAISFIENALNFVNRSDANWSVSVGDGLACAAITLAINGAGIPNINAVVDLNVSGAAGAAPGTFAASSGTTTAPVVNRSGLTEGTLPSTYYFASTSNSPMPVEMTSFTASMQSANSAILRWSTATEVNNNGFEVERRAENTSAWTKLGFITSAGTSTSPREYSYQDVNLLPGVYIYRLKQIDNSGAYKYSATTQVDVGVSRGFELLSNYPNPFNPETNIRFSVPENGFATLKVYNMLGQEVATLFSGIAQAGHYIPATFNAGRLASGVYFSRLEYSGKSIVQRMVLTK